MDSNKENSNGPDNLELVSKNSDDINIKIHLLII